MKWWRQKLVKTGEVIWKKVHNTIAILWKENVDKLEYNAGSSWTNIALLNEQGELLFIEMGEQMMLKQNLGGYHEVFHFFV